MERGKTNPCTVELREHLRCGAEWSGSFSLSLADYYYCVWWSRRLLIHLPFVSTICVLRVFLLRPWRSPSIQPSIPYHHYHHHQPSHNHQQQQQLIIIIIINNYTAVSTIHLLSNERTKKTTTTLSIDDDDYIVQYTPTATPQQIIFDNNCKYPF